MRIHVACELHSRISANSPPNDCNVERALLACARIGTYRLYLMTSPSVPIEGYRDSFGDWCNRLVAPASRFSLGTDAIIGDPGMSDPI